MYIVGKHPRSLLKDIDRRINFAYFRLTQQGIVQSTLEEEEEKSQPVLHKTQRAKDDIYIGQPMKFDYDKINQSIQSRYKKTEQRIDGQVFRALGWLFFLLLGLAAVYLMTRSFYGTNELYNSFHWLPR
jgi:tetrahydromethanopterin S-methyltransferase subunit G